LIVGDGIREGVEAIAEYLQTHAGLHFTLGLVELPIFLTPSGERLVAPRVLARTETLVRTVVAAPEGMMVVEGEQSDDVPAERRDSERKLFWTEFLSGLTLDDPDQRKANATNQGAIYFPLPGTMWLTVYRNVAKREVGLFLSYTRGSEGERILRRLLADWDEIRTELDGAADIWVDMAGEKSEGSPRTLIIDKLQTGSLAGEAEKIRAFEWLRGRTNDFINVFRPRIRAAAADLNLEVR
jgi:hypothetical protein